MHRSELYKDSLLVLYIFTISFILDFCLFTAISDKNYHRAFTGYCLSMINYPGNNKEGSCANHSYPCEWCERQAYKSAQIHKSTKTHFTLLKLALSPALARKTVPRDSD